MIIWFSLIFPLLSIFILWKWFRKETVAWEYILPFAVSLVCIFILKFTVEYSVHRDNEFLGSMVKQVRYYEPWNEYIHRTCYRSVRTGKNTSISVPYDCSYVDYNPARYTVITTEGREYDCSKELYTGLMHRFNNNLFVELNRNSYTVDGDLYKSTWDGSELSAFPLTFEETYTNYIKSADQSIFHMEPVDDSTASRLGVKDYPPLTSNFQQSTILGAPNTKYFNDADWKLRKINGRVGPSKQCRMFVVYFQNKPRASAFAQKAFWQGGNKNEIIVCIGVDSTSPNKVKWVEVFSWSKSERLKTDLKNYILDTQDTTLNLHGFLTYAEGQIQRQFVRREFEEFSYLTVEPSTTLVVVSFLVALVVSILTTYFVIANGISNNLT